MRWIESSFKLIILRIAVNCCALLKKPLFNLNQYNWVIGIPRAATRTSLIDYKFANSIDD